MSNLFDTVGKPYSTPDNKQAQSGTNVTIHTNNGPVQGRMIGGYVVPNN
jgi:hypothetical protein